eukprot:snap_masked-scaffold_69-processed-gene-0.5-mRNA-1 protein AED:1.00 eAED:1.00 QI:0/-1/0/0/-1/1/1/0/73
MEECLIPESKSYTYKYRGGPVELASILPCSAGLLVRKTESLSKGLRGRTLLLVFDERIWIPYFGGSLQEQWFL